MVFVHARNATVKTAMNLRELAKQQGDILEFQCEQDNYKYGSMQSRVSSRLRGRLDKVSFRGECSAKNVSCILIEE